MDNARITLGDPKDDILIDYPPDEYTKKVMDDETLQDLSLSIQEKNQRTYKNGSVIICTF